MTRPNIVLITADDLNWNSVGAYGCQTPEGTPNIDALAADGVRFNYGHVTIAVCQPSRGALMTGRYPHKSGQEGFHYINHRHDVPLLPAVLREAGYISGIIGKAWHSTPRQDFKWDLYEDMEDLGWGRDAELYHGHTKQLIEMAREADKPFFLMANSHDPHRPFHGNDDDLQGKQGITYPGPSRVYDPQEVEIPGFLPDLPAVRREMAEYASSVRRCDDTVGRILDALKDAGVYANTLIMFISDNGMAFPFSKTNCYLHSTKTPWIVCWPGKIEKGSVDNDHFISGIDFMPTALEVAGATCPEGVDGTSFLSLLEGAKDASRDRVFTQFHQTAMRRRYPMRCVQDRRFGYIFNPWSDGDRAFENESQAGRTFRAMQAAGESDEVIAERVELFQHRVVEELYNFEDDPDALVNLIDDPGYQDEANCLRGELEAWMVAHGDLALDAFRNRHSPEALAAFMDEQEIHGRKLWEEGNRDHDAAFV
ncbi:MAG: sulfatase [Verrucomicrobia bacterium]|jgi:N-sulfoglucosamine sulfohydrolase|nr:sulfatase [Verrucomicrobiota bacterium]MBT7066225.1 sulfatase [Verrucomicrobiota bacterium]MBT7699702.1 sulfatase [Verrucomicrobiota bacterium]